MSPRAAAAEQRVLWPHGWSPRPQHAEVFAAEAAGVKRFCLVLHRRWGKTSVLWQLVIKRALTMPGTLHVYMGPTHTQIGQILWTGRDHLGGRLLDYVPAACVASVLENERQITLVNGSIIRLMSGENPDRLRGLNSVSLVCDEFSIYPDAEVWDVAQPMLIENHGLAAFAYTPAGEGHGLQLYSAAMQSAAWFVRKWTIDETRRDGPGEDGGPIFSAADVARMRADGTPESAIRRDLYCSFETPVAGAIYAVELERLMSEARVTAVPWQSARPVETVWDLGARANNAVIFFQRMDAGPVHVLEALRSGDEGLPALVREVLRRPYMYGTHHVPHDVEARERSTDVSLKAQLLQQGLRPMAVVKNVGIEAGIYAARMLLSRTWIDGVKGAPLLQSLRGYRQNERGEPIKDGVFDHMCDAFRYLAVSKAPVDRSAEASRPTQYAASATASGWREFLNRPRGGGSER